MARGANHHLLLGVLRRKSRVLKKLSGLRRRVLALNSIIPSENLSAKFISTLKNAIKLGTRMIILRFISQTRVAGTS